MAHYTPQVRLEAEVKAVCMGWINFGADGQTPTFTPDPSATPEQAAAAQQVVDDFVAADDWRTYQSRLLWDILVDIQHLSNAQQDKIRDDLFLNAGDYPPKALAEERSNTSALFAAMAALAPLASTSADARKARAYSIALYCVDFPVYLIEPPFDPAINIPGWEPIT